MHGDACDCIVSSGNTNNKQQPMRVPGTLEHIAAGRRLQTRRADQPLVVHANPQWAVVHRLLPSRLCETP